MIFLYNAPDLICNKPVYSFRYTV